MSLTRIVGNSIATGAITGEGFADGGIPVDKLATQGGVSAGDFGSAGNIPSITINAQGIVTRVANVQVEVAEAGFNPFLLAGM
jgi:hypothetical protein|tara:strand:+ start:200 stop:448 length:249 start_codon:yes stop_codon:yes gene_type:complete